MFLVFMAIVLFGLAIAMPLIVGIVINKTDSAFSVTNWTARTILVLLGLWCIASTSYVHVGSDEIAVMKKVYGTSSLSGEHIIATNGEKGPQAQILTPGWHPWLLVNVIYEVENHKVTTVASGSYGFLTAIDGAPMRGDEYLADQFPTGHEIDMLDAEYFLTHGGQRGPQSSILTPGTYRLNPLLWKLEVATAIDIKPGEVGVVKSNTVGSVDFGSLKADKPATCFQKTVSTNASGDTAVIDKVDPGKLTAILVPVGCVGVWEKPLQPGRYYVNEHAYTVTKISTLVQTWEFKGGYKKRFIDLSLDQAGNLKQNEWSVEVPQPQGSADKAVIPRIEGWEVPQELRVLAQVTPDNAPFVVASVGGLTEIESNIMIPTIRSIVRNVLGADGRKVLDLADNRAAMEHLVEDSIRPEGLRAGIVIKEVKFGDPALPPELMVSRLRQQLAEQLQTTYQQEQKAQTQRVETEKARATAEQQRQLVESLIGVQVAEQNKNASKLRGEGQKLELQQIAEGQLAQANVLGQDRVLTITLAEKLLKTISDKPEIVGLIGKLVPQTVVLTGGGGGLDSAAGIIGTLMHHPSDSSTQKK